MTFQLHSIQKCDVTHCSALYMPTRLTSSNKHDGFICSIFCKIVSHATAILLLIAAVDCRHCAKQLILPHLPQDPLNCAVLCWAVMCCAGLCWAVMCCAVLCCAVLCCAVLCCAVLCCAGRVWAVMRCAALCCYMLCCAVLFLAGILCAVLCCAVLCCAVLCCAVLCCAVLEVACSLNFGVHGAQEVAGQVRRHHDGPKGVSRRESFKLSHVIENRLAKGGSGQGFGPHATQANTLTPLEALPEEPTPPQVCHGANNK